jgi:dethiobiotin synthetase
LRANGRSCAGFKPICCGDRRDAELLLSANANGLSIGEINPLWLKTPAAPLTAAQIEAVNINIEWLLDAFRKLAARVEDVFVEGVGGWMVPVRSDYFVKDLAVEVGLPVLVVAQNRLGCLNHPLLTVRSVQAEGLGCAGVFLNSPSRDPDIAQTTNADILAGVLDVPATARIGGKCRRIAPSMAANFGSWG